MVARMVVAVSLIVAGCGGSEQPDDELLLEIPPELLDGSTAGWDGLGVNPPIVRTYEWADGMGLFGPRSGWVGQDLSVPWDDGMAMLVAADGEIYPLHEQFGAGLTTRLTARELLPPGEYQLHVDVDGFETHRVAGLRIGDFGQVEGFDAGVLGDQIFRVSVRSANFSFAPFFDFHLRLRAVDAESAQLTVWAEDANRGRLCRAWQDEVEIGATGLVAVHRDTITVGGATPVILDDVDLLLGLTASGTEVGGVQLTAITDTRPMDRYVAGEGDPDPEGATCTMVAALGMGCFPCEDSDEPFCTSLELNRSHGQAQSANSLLTSIGSNLASVDQAPECGGPDDSSDIAGLICSSVGPAGVGAWFIGLGAALVRRRKRATSA